MPNIYKLRYESKTDGLIKQSSQKKGNRYKWQYINIQAVVDAE
jgi:hypothetical protein